jgi:hypothetical protein
MRRDIQLVINDIDALSTALSDDHERLKRLSEEYFDSEGAGADLDVWFRLYERLPDDNGTGHFTIILHNLEAQSGYAQPLVRSVQRRPTRYPVLMLKRLLNRILYDGYPAGFRDVLLLGLLRQVAANEAVETTLRHAAAEFADDYQRDLDEANHE